MAFVCNQITPSSSADLLVKFEAELVDMGWVLHDTYKSFSSGGTHQVVATDTITGATSGATAVVTDVVLVSGTWAGGNAVGFFGLSSVTGHFVAENLNEGANNNVCTTVDGLHVVYKSNGEDADRIYEYMRFELSVNNLDCNPYGWWNNTTHTGLLECASCAGFSYVAGEKLIISGNKNLVVTHRLGYSGVGTYDTMFGHIPKRFYTAPLATLTGPVTSGDGKTISLDNTTKFIPNQTYWLFGAAGEGRDRIKVTSVDPGVSITGDGLTIGFATGAKIGAFPNMFGGIPLSAFIYFNITQNRIVGTGGSVYAVGGLSRTSFIPESSLDPDNSLGYAGAPLNTPGLYVVQPVLFYSGALVTGYSDTYVLIPPITTNDTLFGITADGKALDTGTATDGSSITLTCTGKGWGVNDYADKTVFIDSGTGAGYSRRIVSNTSEILTVNKQWDVTPNNTSIFFIVDEVYRSTGLGIAYKEYI